MTPVRQGRNDESIEVGQDLVHRLPALGRGRGKLCLEITRLDLGEHREIIDTLKVVGNPIDKSVADATKLFPVHVTQFGRNSWCGYLWFTHGAISYRLASQ